MEELERQATEVPGLSGGAGGSGEWETRRGLPDVHFGETAARQLQGSKRYAIPVSGCRKPGIENIDVILQIQKGAPVELLL